MKFLCSIFALLIFQCGTAQQITLKRPLTDADFKELDAQVKQCLGYDINFSFGFDNQDFYDDKNFTADKPNTIEQVNELKKKLTGKYTDITIYNQIGTAYKGMYMEQEAAASFSKAFELATANVKQHPDSASAHDLLATVYMNQSDNLAAIDELQKAYNIDKTDSLARIMIPMCNIFSGNFTAAKTAIDQIFNKPDDEFNYCCILTMINYFGKMWSFQQLRPDQMQAQLKNKSPEEIFDLSRFKQAYEKNKDKTYFELLYQFNRHLAICVKTFTISMADVSSAKNMRFNAEAKDIVLLTDIKAFYKRCLTDTSIHNKYLVYKSLANIELLCGNTKDALPYLKTTIQLRPIEKSMLNHNAAEDYDNLAASFFILKDTASYEKTMKEKFAAKPAINPLLADYGCMAKIAFNHKDSIAAKKFATAGLQLSKKLPDAYICLAAINIMNGNITAAYKNADDLYNVDPKNFANYILQGICLMHDKQSSAAYTSFGMAKELVNDPEWIDNDLLKRFFTVQ